MDAKTLILGTGSPRRIELLKKFDVPFRSVASGFDEDTVPLNLSPDLYVHEIAYGKAKVLREEFEQNPILTADTTVYFNGDFYNKPQSREEAFETLKKFQNNEHEVWTGLCLATEDAYFSETAKTKVFFNPLTDDAIWNYIDCFNPLDKAGSYAIQDAAGLLVNRIDGSFHNVIGFPLTNVAALLKHVGIDLWECLKNPSVL